MITAHLSLHTSTMQRHTLAPSHDRLHLPEQTSSPLTGVSESSCTTWRGSRAWGLHQCEWCWSHSLWDMLLVFHGATHVLSQYRVAVGGFHRARLPCQDQTFCSAREKRDTALYRPLVCPTRAPSHSKAQHYLPAGWLNTPRYSTGSTPTFVLAFSC